MDGVAIVKDESGRNGHSKRCQVADHPAEKRPKKEDPENRNQTCQDDRKPQGPEVAAEDSASLNTINLEHGVAYREDLNVQQGGEGFANAPSV